MQRVLIAAGGTGGHIFPALAVAEKLQQQGVTVHWVASNRGLERQVVAPRFVTSYLLIEALRGKGLKGYVLLPIRLLRGLWQARKIIHAFKPDVVLTMGSFVSGPIGLAAWLVRVPLVVHEQNAIAGMTNRWLARLAKQVLQAFPDTFQSADALTVGNPLRESILQIDKRYVTERTPMRILVVGGSQGAKTINEVVIEWAEQYALADEVELWHQAGKNHFHALSGRYNMLDLNVNCCVFIDEMQQAYEWADLIICRAGALTVWEVAACGLAAIFVPFPYAVDDHQYRNAKFLADQGGAVIVREPMFTADVLQQMIQKYLSQRERLVQMGEQAKLQVNGQAADDVIQVLHQMSLTAKKLETDRAD